jgi:hypothetical protein
MSPVRCVRDAEAAKWLTRRRAAYNILPEGDGHAQLSR